MTTALHQCRAGVRAAAVLLALVIFPLAASALGQEYYIGFATRILVFGMAAASLNLILGYGGMVSFGHAAFFGTGAYAVAVLMANGVTSAWIAWPAAIVAAAALAGVIGFASLRTRGLYFIMITLAFAQVAFYLVVSLKGLGGDDGMALAARSRVGFDVDLGNDATFFHVVLAFAVASAFLLQRLVNARFGRALQAIRENETRMEAIGFPVLRMKLTAFVIAGGLAGLGGALLANLNGRVGPGLLDWPQSGTLLVMVILGGVGFRFGGFLGAAVLLSLEEILSAYTTHWQLALGILLLVVVFRAPRGLGGLLARPAARG